MRSSGMFEKLPEKIIVAYGQYQPMFEQMEKTIPGLILHAGLPSRNQIEEWSANSSHTVLLLDDMMNEVTRNQDSVTLFCVTAHHRNVTVIFLTQNLFTQGVFARTISLNCHYIILMKSARDVRQIITLGSQVFPGKALYFKEAYEKSTSVPFGYLLLDLTPTSPDKYRLRTQILPNQNTIVYVPK